MRMGVDVPTTAVAAILKDQKNWTDDQVQRSSAKHLEKRILALFVY